MEFTTADFYHFILLRITEEAGQKEWEDKVRGVLRAAQDDKVNDDDFKNFCKRFFETGAEAFGAIKIAIREKAQETKDRHKGLLVQSENGNPFKFNHLSPDVLPFDPNQLRDLILSPNFYLCKPNHLLGENMIGAKGLEDLRAGWAKTQAAPVETIEVSLPKLLRYTKANNSDLRVKLVSVASRSYTIRDFEGLEELFIRAWKTIFPENENTTAPMQAGSNTSNEITQSTPPIREFSYENIDILKSYFIAAFKGMGNNINHFDENLLTDLKKKRTGIEYAKIAKLIYESPKTVNNIKSKPFNKWYAEFCGLMKIAICKYKPSQIVIDNILRSEFYYLG